MPNNSYDTKQILRELKSELMKTAGQPTDNSFDDNNNTKDTNFFDQEDKLSHDTIMAKLDLLHQNQLKMMAILTELNFKIRR